MASAKARLQQLQDWLEWRERTSKKPKKQKKTFSRMDLYKETRQRYGSKNDN